MEKKIVDEFTIWSAICAGASNDEITDAFREAWCTFLDHALPVHPLNEWELFHWQIWHETGRFVLFPSRVDPGDYLHTVECDIIVQSFADEYNAYLYDEDRYESDEEESAYLAARDDEHIRLIMAAAPDRTVLDEHGVASYPVHFGAGSIDEAFRIESFL